MPIGISINIGVRTGSADCECGGQTLCGPENDAKAMADIARAEGFRVTLLLAENASRFRLHSALTAASKELGAGDILLLTFAGHGCRIAEHPESGEFDGYNETWCLDDEEIPDHALHRCYAEFQPGVRIVVVADSCHSGSMLIRTKDGLLRRVTLAEAKSLFSDVSPPFVSSPASLTVGLRKSEQAIAANVLVLAACREFENAQDGCPYGLFTEQLLAARADGGASASYLDLMKEVHARVSGKNSAQHPGYSCDGSCDPALRHQRAFSI